MKLQRLAFPPNLLWDVAEPEALARIASANGAGPLLGQFSILHEDRQQIRLVRDRLGLNKLFYHVDAPSGTVTVGHYLHEVANATRDYNGVRSVTAGHRVTIDRHTLEQTVESHDDLSRVQPEAPFDGARFRRRVDERLSRLFRQLARTMPGKRFVICLSGGLDSALIASYAARHLPDVAAVTFFRRRAGRWRYSIGRASRSSGWSNAGQPCLARWRAKSGLSR